MKREGRFKQTGLVEIAGRQEKNENSNFFVAVDSDESTSVDIGGILLWLTLPVDLVKSGTFHTIVAA